jgi:putative ABC transport system permease protein
MTWLGSLDVLRQDARYAWRSIVRTPEFTATVVLTLALGIGLNATMFSFLDRLFVRPPSGVESPGTLRRLWVERFQSGRPSFTAQQIGYPYYSAIRDEVRDIADVALYIPDNGMSLGRDYAGAPVHGVYATSNYFGVLGLRPVQGRFFGADEDVMGNGSSVIVIGETFWRTRLARDPQIIGKQLAIGRRSFTVIGIAPEKFAGLDVQPADIWLPLATFPALPSRGVPWWRTSTTYTSTAIARARTGFADPMFETRATNALRRVAREMTDRRLDSLQRIYTGSIIEAHGPAELGADMVIATRLGGVALIVLIIACANVVNLLLARAVSRRREIAVRLALGVSRWRLVRLLTTETLLLALLAAAAAIVTAWWGGGMLRTLLLPNIEWIDSPLDFRVAVFAVGIALAAGLVAGLVPAIQSSDPSLTDALKAGAREGGAQRSRLRSGLVVLQTALSVVLVVGAALFVRSLNNVQGIDLGFDAERTVHSYLYFESGEDPADSLIAQRLVDIARDFERRPDVEAVARASYAPMRGVAYRQFYFGSDSAQGLREGWPGTVMATPAFFRASGLPIVRGRGFSGSEYGVAPNEVVVNEVAAKGMWPREDPIGQCVRFNKPSEPCYTVVGVAKSQHQFQVIERAAPFVYVPVNSVAAPLSSATDIVVRPRPGFEAAVTNDLGVALRRAFPNATATVKGMAELLKPQYQPWRIGAGLFTAFGVLAMIVALVGIYSSIAYGVGQRTREFGVRVALGAQVRDILDLVLGEGLRVALIGIALGVALSFAATKLIASMLFGVQPSDPSVLLLVTSSLLLVAGIAALIPAWKAARVDPVVALRAE